MKHALLLLLALLPFIAQGQTLETRYLNARNKFTSKDSAVCYVTAVFNASNHIKGAYTKYYMNGHKMEEGFIGETQYEGKLLRWHENGQQQGVWSPAKGHIIEPLGPTAESLGGWILESYWLDDGAQVVENGNGTIEMRQKDEEIKTITQYENGMKHGKMAIYIKDTLICETLYEKNIAVNTTVRRDGQMVEVEFSETQATPVGGIAALYGFFAQQLHYPKEAKDKKVQGKVFLEFVVDLDGSIKDIKVLRGIGSGCDEEAMRVLSLSPKWNPATQKGRPVRQKLVFPINFKL